MNVLQDLKDCVEPSTGPVFSLKWNRTGSLLLTGSVDKTAVVWDTKTGDVVQQVSPPPPLSKLETPLIPGFAPRRLGFSNEALSIVAGRVSHACTAQFFRRPHIVACRASTSVLVVSGLRQPVSLSICLVLADLMRPAFFFHS